MRAGLLFGIGGSLSRVWWDDIDNDNDDFEPFAVSVAVSGRGI